MRQGLRSVRWWLSIGLIAACTDNGVVPPGAPQAEPASAPEAASTVRDGTEGYPTRGELQTGFIRGRTGNPLEVTYEVHRGMAIWEGDINLGRAVDIPKTREALLGKRPVGPSYGVVTTGAGRVWPNGIVPFEIDAGLTNQARVTNAIAMVELATAGVDLVPRAGQADYIRFVASDGCSSWVGRTTGMQDIELATGCSTGSTAHEILHALGMFHEQSRCDRDAFVTIVLANVESGRENNFDKECAGARDIGAYDEGSIMHYGPTAFSTNGQATIVSRRSRDADMGQRARLGDSDIETINDIYGSFNDAPIAVIGALAPSYPEGTSVPFSGGGSSDPDDGVLTYAWTFGDGRTATGVSPSNAYADDGIYTVTLTVSDGFLTNATSTTVSIGNVPPTVNVGADVSRNEGQAFSQGGSFVDPGTDTWTATVDYGEGAGPQALALSGKTFQLSHTYADNGTYTVTVVVTDDDSQSGTDALTATVANVAPTVDAGANLSIESGQSIPFSGTFSDPGVNDAPWMWTLNWGFGTPASGTTNSQSAPITASRLACAAGTYTLQLSVTDKDGGTGTDGATLTVPFRAVSIDISPGGQPNPLNLGKNGVLPVAILSSAVFDARSVDPATVMIGDGVGTDAPVAKQNKGTWQVSIEDVNGDGRLDQLFKFDVTAIVATGDVSLTTTQLVVRAFLADGCTNVRGVDSVKIVP